MANTFKGVGIQWAVSGSTSTAFGTMKLQSRDQAAKADKDEVRDGIGNIVQVTYYNPTETATFTYIPTGTAGLANVTPTIPSPGTMITVTDTNGYTQIAATSWMVDDWSTQGSNTSAMRVTVNMTKYPEITS